MFFKKKRGPAAPQSSARGAAEGWWPQWDLGTMTARLKDLVPMLENKEIEPPLVQARLADHYRDLNLEPMPPAQFDRLVTDFDAESWRRLALAVETLDHADLRSPLAQLTTPVTQQIKAGFIGTARKTDALSLSLLRQSDVRIEEFARHFANRLGLFWRGETEEQSRKRLEQIDYKRLLAEADEAKKQAEERMKYLRQKQEQDLARRRPRGKQ